VTSHDLTPEAREVLKKELQQLNVKHRMDEEDYCTWTEAAEEVALTLLAQLQARDERIKSLEASLQRLGSMEGFVFCGTLGDSGLADECRARIDFARAAMKPKGAHP